VTNGIQMFYYKITLDCKCGTTKVYILQFQFIVEVMQKMLKNFDFELRTVKNKPGLSVNRCI
jgi:hypothetical protein